MYSLTPPKHFCKVCDIFSLFVIVKGGVQGLRNLHLQGGALAQVMRCLQNQEKLQDLPKISDNLQEFLQKMFGILAG